ncbi:pyridoxal-dependent decarboxylase, exosortase A system-associated [Endozoicomonas sp. SM1973]|uniref:Pyridoxal-dependent decarboxylase, exosortase A system-associated n=1 Tax=Spartinivicinus marinus TaxID=2994442 RepID=A0A853ICL2_9GAMM|nr:pyridoxal-dependent decarboxylase, exosortase A system-associated [Spartinivicinus marinus]MCX4024969.1 pyridoxal-dependent decarboxylase, exosortase A system-associated [Spartinivicinus marinus]NYZ67661.1 pyridoxal-dependent decarboxylase, exosortase A system-associated [Spartinivicinus marinus]
MQNKPVHTPLKGFTVTDNCLQIAGKSLPQIASIVGSTPFYCYDRQLLSQRVNQLKQALPEPIKLHYAIKANPMPAVVDHMATLVDGLDVASIKELHTALNSGMNSSNISFAGPGKTNQELTAAIASAITINVESTGELHRIEAIGQRLKLKPNIAFRVNPNYELKTSGMKMSGGPKQFGIDAEQLPDILNSLNTDLINLQGFHIFSGSQNLKVEALIEAHNKTFALATELAAVSPVPLIKLNIGGGLGIPYFPGETDLELTPICHNLSQLISRYHSTLSHCELVIELGRYLVGEAGVYVAEIIDIKQSRGQTFLITNGGLHHHLANSGNFGQVIRKNYPVYLGNKMNKADYEPVQIVGPLCTPLDTLGDKVMLPKADTGDLIVITQSGAYGPTASPAEFLSHPPVKEILL